MGERDFNDYETIGECDSSYAGLLEGFRRRAAVLYSDDKLLEIEERIEVEH